MISWGSIFYGAGHVLHPRMLWLMLWPMLVALAIWGAAALVLWGKLALHLAEWHKLAAQTLFQFRPGRA